VTSHAMLFQPDLACSTLRRYCTDAMRRYGGCNGNHRLRGRVSSVLRGDDPSAASRARSDSDDSRSVSARSVVSMDAIVIGCAQTTAATRVGRRASQLGLCRFCCCCCHHQQWQRCLFDRQRTSYACVVAIESKDSRRRIWSSALGMCRVHCCSIHLQVCIRIGECAYQPADCSCCRSRVKSIS
jgi:hypothetical protein